MAIALEELRMAFSRMLSDESGSDDEGPEVSGGGIGDDDSITPKKKGDDLGPGLDGEDSGDDNQRLEDLALKEEEDEDDDNENEM